MSHACHYSEYNSNTHHATFLNCYQSISVRFSLEKHTYCYRLKCINNVSCGYIHVGYI